MIEWAEKVLGRSKAAAIAASLGLALAIGVIDYLTGFELYFFAFYLIPVIVAGWYVGPGFGTLVSILCVGASVAGDLIAGARYSSSFVPIWNGLILVAVYGALISLLTKLRKSYNELEERVRHRTAALHAEMDERLRLEEEILRISEREQVRIGFDLHDSLCQHLTATALAGQVLSERLAGSPDQAEAASRIVRLIEEAIALTRNLARGLAPVELTGEGLMDALGELASVTRQRFEVDCQFEYEGPIAELKADEALHLYRIAQEATNNALKHSEAGEIVIRLECAGGELKLTVTDDGVGLPEGGRQGKGMGLRIMAHRASLAGATFQAKRLPSQGTRVTCTVPLSKKVLEKELCPPS